jgi:dephospho-CoA kinase
MGKSTTARMFAEEGCPVWDADAAVHGLYAKGGGAAAPMAQVFPEAVSGGVVCRKVLKHIIRHEPDALQKIEAIVHPLVARDREAFLNRQTAPISVLDIPLLFETGAERYLDATAVVFTTDEEQRARVLARDTLDAGQFEAIKRKQMPNDEKLARADYVIETDNMDHAHEQVRAVIDDIRRNRLHA